MADIKVKYPSSSTVAISITLTGGLASDTGLVIGRESAAIDNQSNLDLDHLVSGVIYTGTSPTADRVIEVWAYAPISVSGGTPTYPDSLTGSDAGKTFTSRYVLASALRPVWATSVDANSDRGYFIPPTSIASLYGYMPTHWGLFVVHNTAVNLRTTAHALSYLRVQQSVA